MTDHVTEPAGGANQPTSPATAGPDPNRQREGRVFISHEKTDHGLAREIRAHLEAGGFQCWMAPDNISGPTPWPVQISRAINGCDVLLVIVSANANESPHVSREVDLAVERGKPLLPVRIEDIAPTGSLDYLLRLAQWIDVFPGAIADHADPLRSMVASMLGEQRIPTTPVTPVPAESRRSYRNAFIAVAVLAVLLLAGIIALTSRNDGADTVTGDTVTDDTVTESTAADDSADGSDGVDADEPQPTTVTEAGPTSTIDEPGQATTGAPTNAPAPLEARGDMIRVSISTLGGQANGESLNAALSPDARFVAFDSVASNLVDGDSGAHRDVFLHDRETGTTTRISKLADGTEANGDSHTPLISADGRYVAFASEATNLDPTDSNDRVDIFLHDRESGTTNVVSIEPDGTQHRMHSIEPSMSDDGALIAYATWKDPELPYFGGPLSGVFTGWAYDVNAKTTTRLADFSFAEGVCVASYGPQVSPDGSVAIAECGPRGAYLYRQANREIVPLPLKGAFMIPTGSGRVFFADQDQENSTSWDLFVFDIESEAVSTLADVNATWTLDNVSISADGRYLSAVKSDETGSFNDWFIVDTSNGSTSSLTLEYGLTHPAGPGSSRLDLSGDGKYGAFSSTLSDLVDDDTNETGDIFVIQLLD